MTMATTGNCSECGLEIDLTGKKKHKCIPKCPICNRKVSEFPGQTCAGKHGRCGVCGEWRAKCKCLRSQVMEQMKKPFDETQGLKYDGEKLDWAHLPKAIEEVLKVYMMGAKKYHRGNYLKGIDFRRIFNAAQRHLWAWKHGEDTDPESELSHLANATWNCLTLLEYMLAYPRYKEFDNRSEIIQPPTVTVWPDNLEQRYRRKPETSAEAAELDQAVCAHEWVWQSQYSDTAGIHITQKCKRCGAINNYDLLPPEPTGTVSIPTVWLPTPEGQVIEATVTTATGGDEDTWLQYNDGVVKVYPKRKLSIGRIVKIKAGAKYRHDFATHIWQGDDSRFSIHEAGPEDGPYWWLVREGYTKSMPGNYFCMVREADLEDVTGGE